MSSTKSFKVWNNTKERGKLISANKLDEMMMKTTCTSPSSNENLLDLVKKIRNKRTSLNTQSRTTISQAKERTCKINIGWMAFHNNRYTQVRAMSGGGTRTVDFPLTADYNSIMEKAKELFFPNGTSKKGTWGSFSHCLGDFKQNLIPSAMFLLKDYVRLNCLTTKPRLYLMSKPKEEEEDWELPDLDLNVPSPNVSLISVPSSPELPDLLHVNMDDLEIPVDVWDINVNAGIAVTNATNATVGTNATNATAGTDATNATTGTDATNATAGTDATNATAGTDATNATAGTDATNATTGTDATNATAGTDATNATAGTDATNATAGTDATNVTAGTDAKNATAGTDATAGEMDVTVCDTDHSYVSPHSSPVIVNMPKIPTCQICADRYCDSFLSCGHIICYVCAIELDERDKKCHICRNPFTTISKLYY